ncbi:hypothetical protein BGW42_002554 [Actinomortierella wolfii]|nr:hypothetical protein BGW42_002554 [Actinomortierella wolfii]
MALNYGASCASLSTQFCHPTPASVMARQTMKDDIVVNNAPAILQQYMPSAKSGTKSGSNNNSTKNNSSPNAKPTRRQVLIQKNADRHRQYERMVSEWQDKLLDPVSEQVLGEADIKGKFRISLNERKVYDITPLKQFCSSKCLVASRWFVSQLTEEPLYLRNTDPEQLSRINVSIVPLDMDLEYVATARVGFEKSMQKLYTEFQRIRGRHAPVETTASPKPTNAFSIEAPERLAKVVPTHAGTDTSKDSSEASHQQQQQSSEQPQSSSTSMAALSPNASAYIQSILATVPSTPSTIRIVERESSLEPSTLTSAMSTERSSQNDIDRAMQDAYGTPSRQHDADNATKRDTFEIVEGFRVPTSRSAQQKPSTMLLSHRKKHGITSSAESQDSQKAGSSASAVTIEDKAATDSIEKGLKNIKIADQQPEDDALV